MATDDVKFPLAFAPAWALVPVLAALLLFGAGACSGAKGSGANPASPRAAEPCATPDQGTGDMTAASYYQIGTCPVDENEGAEVNQDE